MGLLLLIIVLLLVLGGLPTWPHSRNWGYGPTAAADAALNDFSIKMIGHPATGKDATNVIKLTVQMP